MKTKIKKKIDTLKCCYGISSKCGYNKATDHVFMMDYDIKNIYDVVEHLKNIQKEYNLSDIYVISSSNGYNAISLDIIGLPIIYCIGIDICSPTDKKFTTIGYHRGYYTLRFDRDKEIVDILKNRSNKYYKSLAHKQFLEFFFNIEINNNHTFNENEMLDIIQYHSNKNGYHIIERDFDIYEKRIRKI